MVQEGERYLSSKSTMVVVCKCFCAVTWAARSMAIAPETQTTLFSQLTLSFRGVL